MIQYRNRHRPASSCDLFVCLVADCQGISLQHASGGGLPLRHCCTSESGGMSSALSTCQVLCFGFKYLQIVCPWSSWWHLGEKCWVSEPLTSIVRATGFTASACEQQCYGLRVNRTQQTIRCYHKPFIDLLSPKTVFTWTALVCSGKAGAFLVAQ